MFKSNVFQPFNFQKLNIICIWFQAILIGKEKIRIRIIRITVTRQTAFVSVLCLIT